MASFIFNSFKGHLLSGNINLASDPIHCMLMKSTYTPNMDSHKKYSDVSGHEHTGNGVYFTGGKALSSKSITIDNTNDWAYFTANNVTWASTTLSASGAILLASGAGYGGITNPLIGYIDFGSTLSSSNGDYTITWSANGIIRIANG